MVVACRGEVALELREWVIAGLPLSCGDSLGRLKLKFQPRHGDFLGSPIQVSSIATVTPLGSSSQDFSLAAMISWGDLGQDLRPRHGDCLGQLRSGPQVPQARQVRFSILAQ